jgi:uncharacterized protein (DUF362 family)
VRPVVSPPGGQVVAVCSSEAFYPKSPPWGPEQRYPEYPWDVPADAEPNPAYRAVRGAMELLGLDAAGFDTRQWNPLGGVVSPGDTVVLKPNFIRHFHDTRGEDIEAVVTHGSIIRAVLDYVAIALKGEGRIVIADAPQCEASFEKLSAHTGLEEIRAFYRQRSPLTIEVIDLRPEFTEKIDGVIVGHRKLPGDPAGYTVVNLGRDSEFYAINHMNHRLYGSEYDRSEVAAHHHDDVHEYLISKTVMAADVFINLPKMKTHKKVGVTLNLKNLVGINGNKNWLPHHREGVPASGGDQYAASGVSERLEHLLLGTFKKHFPKLGRLRRHVGGAAKRVGKRAFGDTDTTRIRSGNWWGNDTTWRMVLDLNRALRYADAEGVLHETPQRRYFSFVDGIIAGEGNGPMDPDARDAGVVLAGADPLAVDLTCTRIMGLDWRKIPTLDSAMRTHPFDLCCGGYDELTCRSNVPEYDMPLHEITGPCLSFHPHFGWTGRVEWAA